jgi:hypothetical protein
LKIQRQKKNPQKMKRESSSYSIYWTCHITHVKKSGEILQGRICRHGQSRSSVTVRYSVTLKRKTFEVMTSNLPLRTLVLVSSNSPSRKCWSTQTCSLKGTI